MDRSTSSKRLLVVAAALIDEMGRVLVQQRPPGKPLAGLWEFPGGKVDIGETPEAALVRELAEELAIGVDEVALQAGPFVSAATDDGHLVMLLYLCRVWRGSPRALHATDIAWRDPHELAELAMPPADRPLVAALIRIAATRPNPSE